MWFVRRFNSRSLWLEMWWNSSSVKFGRQSPRVSASQTHSNSARLSKCVIALSLNQSFLQSAWLAVINTTRTSFDCVCMCVCVCKSVRRKVCLEPQPGNASLVPPKSRYCGRSVKVLRGHTWQFWTPATISCASGYAVFGWREHHFVKHDDDTFLRWRGVSESRHPHVYVCGAGTSTQCEAMHEKMMDFEIHESTAFEITTTPYVMCVRVCQGRAIFERELQAEKMMKICQSHQRVHALETSMQKLWHAYCVWCSWKIGLVIYICAQNTLRPCRNAYYLFAVHALSTLTVAGKNCTTDRGLGRSRSSDERSKFYTDWCLQIHMRYSRIVCFSVSSWSTTLTSWYLNWTTSLTLLDLCAIYSCVSKVELLK